MKISKGTVFKVFIIVCVVFLAGTLLLSQTKRIRPTPGHMVFHCKMLIDPATEKTIENAFIEINNGKILNVGSWNEYKSEEGVEVVDISGKYIIPGLIDTHGHLFGWVITRNITCAMHPAFYLAAGVTTVRSPGSMDPGGDLTLRDRIDAGQFLGPRYFHSGPYVEMHPVSVKWMNPVQSPEEARLKIEHWIKQGATSVKIYAKMEGEILKAAIEHGHAHGVKVIAHVGAVSWREAIRMGIDELFHGVHAFPEMTLKKGEENPDRKILTVDSPEIQEILEMAARAKVVITPTADIVDPLDYDKCHLDEQKKYYTLEALEVLEKRREKALEKKESREKSFAENKKLIKMAHDAGCILTTGTDQVGFSLLPGFSLWREMEIFAEAGLSPMEILKTATINGAFAIGRSDLLGSLQGGMLADFVILDMNPLENISHVRNVFKIVKGGVVYEPEKLLKPLEGKYQ